MKKIDSPHVYAKDYEYEEIESWIKKTAPELDITWVCVGRRDDGMKGFEITIDACPGK